MQAIQGLVDKQGRFDYILLETSGLADPAPIVSGFWNEPSAGLGALSDLCLYH